MHIRAGISTFRPAVCPQQAQGGEPTPGVVRKNVAFLSLLGFLVSLGFGLIAPIMPFYLEVLGGTAFELGLLLSSFMVTRALLSRYFGRISDAVGRKRLVVAGAAIYSVLGFLFTIPTHWSGLIFVRGLQGVASAMVWPVGEALVVDSSPEEARGKAMSVYVLASNLGFAAGPFAGGGLLWVARYQLGLGVVESFHFPFYFIAAFSGVATLLTQSFVKDVLPPREMKEVRGVLRRLGPFERSSAFTARARRLPKETRKQVNVILMNALGNGFSFSLISFLPIFYMKDFLGLDEVLAGTILGLAMSVGIAMNIPAGFVADRLGRKPLVVVGGYVSRASSAFIPFSATTYQVAGLMVFRSLAFQVSQPAMKALQADLFPEKLRGRLIGTVATLFNMGAIFGAPLGGVLYDLFKDIAALPWVPLPGVAIPFLISALMGFVTVTLVLLFVEETLQETLEKKVTPTEV